MLTVFPDHWCQQHLGLAFLNKKFPSVTCSSCGCQVVAVVIIPILSTCVPNDSDSPSIPSSVDLPARISNPRYLNMSAVDPGQLHQLQPFPSCKSRGAGVTIICQTFLYIAL
jgi:hypothetical protein